MNAPRLLQQLIDPGRGAFALLHRPESVSGDRVEILRGRISAVARLADVPLPDVPLPETAPGGEEAWCLFFAVCSCWVSLAHFSKPSF